MSMLNISITFFLNIKTVITVFHINYSFVEPKKKIVSFM